jgi:acyl dehydratase
MGGERMSTGRRHYEDVQVGEAHVSPSITVTEAHIVQFAGISSDFSRLHMDEEYGKTSIFGTRVAHGLLGLAITDGLKMRTDAFRVEGLASLGWTWDFAGPIRIGDTVTVHFKVARKRETRKPDQGIVYLACELMNQRGEVVHRGEHRLMVKRKCE